MRLPDSASIFTAEIWAIIKTLEEIKNYVASKYIVLVEWNHFAEKRKDIFGGRDVVESFRFQPTLILFYLKEFPF